MYFFTLLILSGSRGNLPRSQGSDHRRPRQLTTLTTGERRTPVSSGGTMVPGSVDTLKGDLALTEDTAGTRSKSSTASTSPAPASVRYSDGRVRPRRRSSG